MRPAAALALAAGVLVYVGRVDPNQAGHYPTCPFLAVTGWYCPGCGTLRALHALGHADVPTALARNPLTVLSAVVLGVLWARWAVRSVTGPRPATMAPPWLVWGSLTVLVAFWVLRNLPGTAWLAP